MRRVIKEWLKVKDMQENEEFELPVNLKKMKNILYFTPTLKLRKGNPSVRSKSYREVLSCGTKIS